MTATIQDLAHAAPPPARCSLGHRDQMTLHGFPSAGTAQEHALYQCAGCGDLVARERAQLLAAIRRQRGR